MGARVHLSIRGVEYPSIAEAARQLGVAYSTVSNALDNGTLDTVGLGRNHDRKKPITVNGVLYESIAEAAKQCNLNPYSLAIAKRKGKKTLKGQKIS